MICRVSPTCAEIHPATKLSKACSKVSSLVYILMFMTTLSCVRSSVDAVFPCKVQSCWLICPVLQRNPAGMASILSAKSMAEDGQNSPNSSFLQTGPCDLDRCLYALFRERKLGSKPLPSSSSRTGCCRDPFSSAVMIQLKMTPNAQISIWVVKVPKACKYCSGAIKICVPCAHFSSSSSASCKLTKPKSMSLMQLIGSLVLRSAFSGLRSQCAIGGSMLWRYWRA
mmetsp:Transcript_148953/g.371129  ORF Transcript_148953/g.371129 Transcript_148953/m.371129 type:complete len:226 (-) Transcript_148953:121-798(-)